MVQEGLIGLIQTALEDSMIPKMVNIASVEMNKLLECVPTDPVAAVRLLTQDRMPDGETVPAEINLLTVASLAYAALMRLAAVGALSSRDGVSVEELATLALSGQLPESSTPSPL